MRGMLIHRDWSEVSGQRNCVPASEREMALQLKRPESLEHGNPSRPEEPVPFCRMDLERAGSTEILQAYGGLDSILSTNSTRNTAKSATSTMERGDSRHVGLSGTLPNTTEIPAQLGLGNRTISPGGSTLQLKKSVGGGVRRTVKKQDPFAADGTEMQSIEGETFILGNGDALDIDMNDVKQGQLGDCYLLAALAAVAKTDPERIRKMVRGNGDNTYTVAFQLGKATKNVTVTSTFNPKYAKPGDKKTVDKKQLVELWVMVVEKAWAQVNGGYAKIEGGNPAKAMSMITGKSTDTYSPSQKSDDKLLKSLSSALKAGHPTTASTPDVGGSRKKKSGWNDLADKLNVYSNHAYALKEVKDGSIVLYNPWGKDHPLPMSPGEFKQLYVRVSINQA